VLKWVVERIEGRADGRRDARSARCPTPTSLDTDGLAVDTADLDAALRVDVDEWRAEIPQVTEWFDQVRRQAPGVCGPSWTR
jgi:phosphoenolpyruvate carboxykinase (GTP)